MTINKISFDAIANNESKILILGSLPGNKSLEQHEYYAHPRNRFWKIISDITSNDFPQTYSEKIDLLLRSRVAVWDITHKAEREGSLDSNIKNEIPNDLDSFIATHQNLKVIAFNGQTAERLFDKYFSRKDNIIYISLPSTSPANAMFNYERLYKEWSILIEKI